MVGLAWLARREVLMAGGVAAGTPASAARARPRLAGKSHVKYRAKRVLARAGIRVRSGGTSRPDLLAAVRHLRERGFRPATVIDVGAADGTFELYETFPAARHVLIEAMTEFEPALRSIVASFGAEYVLAAADATEGTVRVPLLDDRHATSLFRSASGPYREVPTLTLDGLASRLRLEAPYLLKVDVQGAELRVLAGAPEVLKGTEALILETAFFPFNAGVPVFHEVVARAAELGFVPYDLVDGYTRPLDGALAQVDVVFVPEGSAFRADTRFATREQQDRDNGRLMWKARRLMRI
jgi:FkbM family methyltransferase